MKRFDVYVRNKKGEPTGPLRVSAPDHEESKIQVQKFLRKRYGVELGRDYEITKAVEVRRGK